MLKILRIPILLVGLCQAGRADDFNRPSVGYTNTGGKIGWYWQAKGTGTWKLIDHELLVDNADASVQNNDQVLYHTRVSLQSGNWSASVDVRDETSTRRVGMAFMVGANGNNFYQIRLQFGTRQIQVLENGAAGVPQTIYTNDTASSEVFNTANYYTISAWSTAAGQINWTVKNAGADVNWRSRPTSEGYQVASGSFTDSTYTTGYAGIVKSQGDGVTDVAHFDNFYVREITVPPITQPHPRLLVTPADIVEIKAAINAQVEPRYSAWLDLKYYADGWSNDNVAGAYTGQDSNEFYLYAKTNGSKAAKMALAWLLKGNAAHRDKAKAILLRWAQANPLPGSDFPVNSTNVQHSSMRLARSINQFIYAYDFLYNDLTPAERTTVETWFRAVLPSLQAGIDQWNTPTSSFFGSIYYSGGYYQNHTVSPTMGYLLIGYALGDQSLVQFALDHKHNPRPYLTLFDGTVLMPGETFPDVGPGDTLNPPPQAGEIFDRERHFDTSNSPNGTGLAYSALSRNQMMSMTEVLYNNGLNFYTRTGAHGETMLASFNFFADFYRLGDASIKGGFYTGEGVAANYQATVFEVANKRYPGNAEITDLLKSTDRAAMDPGGNIETYFVYPTLTHGVTLPTVTKTWTGAASSIWNTTELNWTGQAWADGSDAVFGTTGAGAITVSGTRSVGDLTLSSVGYSFSGGILSVANTSAANTWSINNNTTISSGVTADFSGGGITGSLVKTGAGTLTLSGAVNSTGFGTTGSGNWGITVNAGNLELSGTSTFSSAGLIVGGTGNATISAGTHNFTGTTQRIGLAVTAGRTVTVSGGSLNTVKILVGNGSSGIYTQSGGTVIMPTTGAGVELGTAGNSADTSVFNLDGGTLVAVQLAPSASWLGTTTINLNGGTFRAVGTSSNLFSATVTGSQSGSIFVKAGGAFIDPNGRPVTISSNLLAHPTSTGGGLTKLGGNTLTLSGVNTYTGPTTVTGGVLAVKGSSIANSNKLVLDGGQVDLTGAETVGTLFFGAVQQAAGSYSATGAGGTIANSNFTGAGTLIVTYGPVSGFPTWTGEASSIWNTTALNWSGVAWTDGDDAVFGATGAGAITVSSTRSVGDLTVSSAGYSFSGGILSVAKLTAANAWTINNDTAISSGVTANFSTGAITGSLVKMGAGTLTLSGAVSSTGFTTSNTTGNWGISVSAGSLVLGGTSSATFVNSGLFVSGASATISGGTHSFTGTTGRKGLAIGGNGGLLTVSGGTITAAQLNAANGSTGTYTQTNGSLTIKSDANASVAVTLGAGGGGATTSTINLDGGTLTALGMAAANGWLGTSTINLNGGTFKSGAANANLFNTTAGTNLTGSIFVKSGGALINTNTFAVTQSQALLAHPTSTGGGLTKLGGNTLTLSGVNTYTGPTTVTGGVLAVKGSSIANSNKLVLDGGQVDLTGAETVGTLFFGAVQQAAGTYSATGAGGTIASPNFTGAGTLIVTSGPPVGGFSTWASANAGNQAADLDSDNDGIPNGVEYFMGQTGSTFTANPPVVTVGAVRTVTWPRNPAAVATFKVQISDSLASGQWTDIVPPNASIDQSNPNQVTYTLPSGATKKFCRLSVTP
jgi:autotransporter-associated beta strand protein